ncbi:hypothetical protein FA95DRAFT_686552 [Auriscalpium vulgare]|uniref:Uncharacterized protein n=1 Tax=Auriscalpium vulgare TaxID=40419 RepID=A0ACB8S1W9_9AGAM|nr:hypothetical protein FA95DRAFT_686552 [Auriscalpium vulgare]
MSAFLLVSRWCHRTSPTAICAAEARANWVIQDLRVGTCLLESCIHRPRSYLRWTVRRASSRSRRPTAHSCLPGASTSFIAPPSRRRAIFQQRQPARTSLCP